MCKQALQCRLPLLLFRDWLEAEVNRVMEEVAMSVKDAFQAEVFRRRGNKSYKDKDLKEALKLYNKVAC